MFATIGNNNNILIFCHNKLFQTKSLNVPICVTLVLTTPSLYLRSPDPSLPKVQVLYIESAV